MKISTSEPNSSLPPPINWVTKPKPSPANTINHSPEHVEESETPARRLVPIFINPNHIPDLKEALQCLSESPHRQAKLVLQADTIIDDDGNIKRIFLIDSRQSQQEDSDAHAEDLASTFSHLSMSTPSPKAVTPASMNSAQSPLGMRTAPVTNSGKSPRTSTMKRRYYVVLVGKCAGIYYDEWENVEPLIRHVSNARYKGFSTHEQAKEFYLNAKQMDKVRIVRNPGDDEKYGPIDDAVQ